MDVNSVRMYAVGLSREEEEGSIVDVSVAQMGRIRSFRYGVVDKMRPVMTNDLDRDNRKQYVLIPIG